MDDTSGTPLKDQYVSTEEYLKKNLTSGEYVKDVGVTIALSAGSGVAGRVVAGHWGAFIGGKLGFLAGVYRHWKKSEGKLENVKSVMQKAGEALDAKALEKEVATETGIIDDLKKLEAALSMRQKANYAETVSVARDAMAQNER